MCFRKDIIQINCHRQRKQLGHTSFAPTEIAFDGKEQGNKTN